MLVLAVEDWANLYSLFFSHSHSIPIPFSFIFFFFINPNQVEFICQVHLNSLFLLVSGQQLDC